MGNYENYLSQLKQVKAAFDADKMYAGVKARLKQRSRQNQLAMGGLLAVLILGFTVYLNFPSNQQSLAGYIYQSGNTNGDPIMNYIYVD